MISTASPQLQRDHGAVKAIYSPTDPGDSVGFATESFDWGLSILPHCNCWVQLRLLKNQKVSGVR